MKLTDPKALPPALRLRYIVEAMAMRARGRDARKAAEAKRVKRAYKRIKTALGATEVRRTHRYEGEVDDAAYAPLITVSSVPGFKERLRAYVL